MYLFEFKYCYRTHVFCAAHVAEIKLKRVKYGQPQFVADRRIHAAGSYDGIGDPILVFPQKLPRSIALVVC